jgi:hypothetical protein
MEIMLYGLGEMSHFSNILIKEETITIFVTRWKHIISKVSARYVVKIKQKQCRLWYLKKPKSSLTILEKFAFSDAFYTNKVLTSILYLLKHHKFQNQPKLLTR